MMVENNDLSATDLAELLLGPDDMQPGASRFQWAPCRYALIAEDGAHHAAPAHDARQLVVRMERSPIVTHDAAGTRYRWHKNCVLPRIHVSVQGQHGEGTEDAAAVRISAVTIDALTNTARSVGLEGVCVRPLVRGECTFASLSFTSTTYTLPGKPQLHLMASLILRRQSVASDILAPDGANGSVVNSVNVACSVISPGMTVDARKRQSANKPTSSFPGSSARFDSGGGQMRPPAEAAAGTEPQPGSSLPFAPDLLSMRLQKVGRESDGPVEIDNSIEGLRAYLSALNIRHKCKHPLFLVMRFDMCIGLAYDTTRANNPAEDDAAFYQMMEAIAATGRRSSGVVGDAAGGAKASGGGSSSHTAGNGGVHRFLPFVIAVKGHHPTENCSRGDCPIRLSSGLSMRHASSLPPTYKLLCERQMAALRKTYCKLYCTHSGTSQPNSSQASLPGQQATSAILKPVDPMAFAASATAAAGSLGHLSFPSREPQLCDTCLEPHHSATNEPPATSSDSSVVVAQGHASALLATVRSMALQGGNCDSDDGRPCPEHEWQQGLRILAEAMAMHCRTRSPAEIVAFMHDELSSSGKRAATNAATSKGLEANDRNSSITMYEHSHEFPTMSCDHAHCEHATPTWSVDEVEEYDADAMLAHVHDHGAW